MKPLAVRSHSRGTPTMLIPLRISTAVLPGGEAAIAMVEEI